ncbi:MAG: EamA family transporter [Saprospirales bacterium]|nr:EamA family transporter [Saprospirales bacterium]MBK8490063.1 EamA family transporter [Saprospirales bacterium]
MPATWKAHTALFLVALIYGGNYSIAKVVLDDGYIQPKGFILLRVMTGVLLFTLLHRGWIREKINRADWWRLMICGLFGVAINQMFFFMGLKRTLPIHASLLMTTTPILVLIISSLLIRERITLRKIVGVILGAVGAVLLLTQGKQVGWSRTGLTGDLMVLVNAASYGLYLVLVRKLMLRYHPITVVRWVFSFGLLFVIPFGAGELVSVDWATFHTWIWLAVLYVLLFTTFFTYLFNAYALSVVTPSLVSFYIYLQPLLAAFIALLMGQDQLDWVKGGAAILIFSGVYLVSRTKTD